MGNVEWRREHLPLVAVHTASDVHRRRRLGATAGSVGTTDRDGRWCHRARARRSSPGWRSIGTARRRSKVPSHHPSWSSASRTIGASSSSAPKRSSWAACLPPGTRATSLVLAVDGATVGIVVFAPDQDQHTTYLNSRCTSSNPSNGLTSESGSSLAHPFLEKHSVSSPRRRPAGPSPNWCGLVDSNPAGRRNPLTSNWTRPFRSVDQLAATRATIPAKNAPSRARLPALPRGQAARYSLIQLSTRCR